MPLEKERSGTETNPGSTSLPTTFFWRHRLEPSGTCGRICTAEPSKPPSGGNAVRHTDACGRRICVTFGAIVEVSRYLYFYEDGWDWSFPGDHAQRVEQTRHFNLTPQKARLVVEIQRQSATA